jgi:hypothetical protein
MYICVCVCVNNSEAKSGPKPVVEAAALKL